MNDYWNYGPGAGLADSSYPKIYGDPSGTYQYSVSHSGDIDRAIKILTEKCKGAQMANNVDTSKKHWFLSNTGILYDTKEKAVNEAKRLLKSNESVVYTIYEAVATVESEPAPAVVKELS